MANTVDFDAMLAEVEAPAGIATFDFKFLGETWQVPDSPPAIDMLQLRKLYMLAAELQVKQDTGRLSEADAAHILEATEAADWSKMLGLMIGEATVKEWLALGITDAQLQHLTRYFWLRYNGKEPKSLVGDGVGEARAPKKGQKPPVSTSQPNQSPLGQPSKPTSNENTVSMPETSTDSVGGDTSL